MAFNVNRGVISTAVNSTTLVRDVDPRIFLREAEVAPLVGFLRKIKRSEKCTNPKFEWIEKKMGTAISALTANLAGASAGDSNTVSVSTGHGVTFQIGDIIWVVETSEHLLVTAVSTDSITVTRGFGTTSPAVTTHASSTPVIVRLGSSFEEGAGAPTGIALTPYELYNYTQIFKTTAECTRTEAQTDRYDIKNPKMVERRKEAMSFHMEEIERAYLFGELKTVTGTNPRRTTRGFKASVTTNVTNCQGTFSKTKFDEFLRLIFLYGGKNKVLLASGSLLTALHSEVFSNSNMLIQPKTSEWGLSVRKYISPFGDIDIAYHRVLSQVLDGYGYAVDLDKIKEKTLQNTTLKMNIQLAETDGFKDQILTESGLQIMNEECHGIIYNP